MEPAVAEHVLYRWSLVCDRVSHGSCKSFYVFVYGWKPVSFLIRIEKPVSLWACWLTEHLEEDLSYGPNICSSILSFANHNLWS